MSIIDDLKWRYATKEFDSNKKVSNEDLDIILESLILSASSFGLQPWKFIIVEHQEIKNQFLKHSWNQKQVVEASHVIVFARPVSFNQSHIESFIQSTMSIRNQDAASLEGYKKMMSGFVSNMSEPELNSWMVKQVYLALGNLLTVTANLRIDSCPMEGFSAPEYDKILKLEEKGLTSVVVCPIGYRSLSDKHGKLPKVRYSKDELILRY